MALSVLQCLCVVVYVCCAGIDGSDDRTASAAAAAATETVSTATVSVTCASSVAVHPRLLSSEIYTSPQTAALRYLVIDMFLVLTDCPVSESAKVIKIIHACRPYRNPCISFFERQVHKSNNRILSFVTVLYLETAFSRLAVSYLLQFL